MSYANLTSPGTSNLLFPNGYYDVSSLERDDYVIYQEYLNNAPGCKNFKNQCTLIKPDDNLIKCLTPLSEYREIFNPPKVFSALPSSNNNLHNLQNSVKSETKLKNGSPTYDQVTQSTNNVDSFSMFSRVNGSSNGDSKFSSVEGLKNIGFYFSNIPSVIGLGGDIIIDSTQKHYSGTSENKFVEFVFSDKVKGVKEKYDYLFFPSEVTGLILLNHIHVSQISKLFLLYL